MKKTQVALAALALVASTAALADGVTVYGTVDAGIVSSSSGTAFAGAGNSNTTLWGLKGTEDLGNGLKAGFNLEGGLNANNGALGANGGVGTSLFNRAANVSLSTESVGVTIGTQISPFILAGLTGTTAVGGNGAFVPALYRLDGGSLAGITAGTGAAGAGTATGGFFIPNAVSVSVNGGGFGANVLYRVKDKVADTESEYTAANLTTSVAGFNLALGYQSTQTKAADERTNILLAGNTTVAGVRLNAAYSDNSGAAANKSTGYILGASMPVMGALSAGLTYANNNKLSVKSQTTVSLQYDLSKATYAYLNYSTFGAASDKGAASNDAAGLAAAKSLLAVGVAHSF